MQSIRTRYCGHTNTKPARVTASCEHGKLTVSWDDALTEQQNHHDAMRALLLKMEWNVLGWVPGQFRGDWYWVQDDTIRPPIVFEHDEALLNSLIQDIRVLCLDGKVVNVRDVMKTYAMQMLRKFGGLT